jgi:hypothetical protein
LEEPKVCKEWKYLGIISTRKHEVSFCDRSGITMKELEELQLGTLLTIQNNFACFLNKGVFIRVGGKSICRWQWKN